MTGHETLLGTRTNDSEPGAATIPDLLHARVEASSDSVAFRHQGERGWDSITWRQFHARVRALAAALIARGLAPGMHVGLLAPTGIDWEVAHHAVLNAGGVVVGLEPHDTGPRLHWIIVHAEVSILMVENRTLLAKVTAGAALDLHLTVFLGGEATALSDREATLRSLLDRASDATPVPAIRPDAPATIIYTSGTTGQPKGILYRHEQVVLAIREITAAYPSIGAGSRFVCWLPLSNLFQRIMNLAAMQVGGTVYLVGNPLDVLATLSEARPDIFIGVPRFYEKLHEGMQKKIGEKPALMRSLIRRAIDLGLDVARARREGRSPARVRRWLFAAADRTILAQLRSVMGGRIRLMITGSAPISTRLLEFFDAIGLPLYEAYGMSENVVPMALNRPAANRFGTVGRPLRVNEIRIDEDGELQVRGPGVFSGYVKDDRADLFTADAFYRTGDYGTLDAQGFLTLRGRKSEIIKTSTGRRISPRAVEEILETVPGVERVVVVGNGRKRLAAIVTLVPDFRTEASFKDITPWTSRLTAASRALAAHEHPAGILLLDYGFTMEAGELTSNLKLRRRAIEEGLSPELDALFGQIEAAGSQSALVMRLVRRS